jgi:predicted ATPase/DNA-binding SARP family transcriptional activator
MKDQPLLEIQLLGNFRLTSQNRETRQDLTVRLKALLVYLLLHRDAPVPRHRLAFLFWPDTSEKQAHTNLRNLLHKLRAVLPGIDSYLSINQKTLHWKSSKHFTLDVENFSRLSSQVTSVDALKSAVQIYTGDLFPDIYDDWIHEPRERLRQIYLTVLENLIALLEKDKLLQEALHYAQILLRHDPIREQTYQHLMRLHALCGDQASVARTYKTCVTVLEQELDVTPGPATEEAYQKYVAQDFQLHSRTETTGILSEKHIPHNLPASLTRLIGRDKERTQVLDLLSKNRLVTLTGPGGIGKTRLALSVVRKMLSDYRDGVFLVDLAPVLDANAVPLAITDALQAGDEVRTAGLDGLKGFLSDQRLLLLLDNCEHLVVEVGLICQELLLACPQLTVLVTSREALKIYGETLFQVPALLTPVAVENPDPGHSAVLARAIRSNESVELFVERALSTLPTFKTDDDVLFLIGEVGRRLEGMPLAIEMAAARVKTLSVQQIVQRLNRATELLQHPASGSYHRHSTMEAAMQWSYSLLKPAERKLFARLGVFSGSFSLQAAEEICQGDGIHREEILDLMANLVDKSLVGTQPAYPEVRFRLHEIVRQYAYQKLVDANRLRYWKDRHLEHFVSLAERAEPHLRGREQVEWVNRLELEFQNMRGALRYAFEDELGSDNHLRNIESAARLAGALFVFWFIRGRFSEGRRWAEQVLVGIRESGRASPSLGKVLYTAGSFCFFQGDFAQAEELSLKSLRVCKADNDLFGVAISYHHLGIVSTDQGDLSRARKWLRDGLKVAELLGDAWLLSVFYADLAALARQDDNPASRLAWIKRSLDTARQSGNKFSLLYDLLILAEIALEQVDTKQATLLAEEGLSLSRELGERRGTSYALQNLGLIAMLEGAYKRANELLRESLHLIWSTRDRESIIESLIALAENSVREGNFNFAVRLLAACEVAKDRFPAGYLFYSQPKYDRLVEMLQNHLEEGAFTAAWTLGRLMSLEQAVSYALKEHSEKPLE